MSLTAAITRRLSPAFALDVTLTVPDGVTILFGASGSGKSTILRSIAGLSTPDTGRIATGARVLFDAASGVNVPARGRRIGYVFQQLALFPHMTVEQNIGYGLDRLSPDDRRTRVRGIAEAFHITGMLTRRPGQVSGGERQRTALARALVTDPDVLLLDEPLSALDYSIQSRIMADLRRWNDARRIPILYVTHSHREAYALGDRLVAIERGAVVAAGSPHEVLDHPAQGGLASLAGFENVFGATVVERREDAGTMQCRLGGSSLELEVPLSATEVGQPLAVAIRAGDILVASQEPSGLSARNILPATILTIVAQGPTMVVTADAGARFVVHLTPGGAHSLGLRAGGRAWLIIKTYSCRVAADAASPRGDTISGDSKQPSWHS